MATNTADQTTQSKPTLGAWAWIRLLLFTTLMPMVTLLAAGDWNWLWGWVLVGFYVISTVISRGLVALKHPELIIERGTYEQKEDAHPLDRKIVSLAALLLPLIGYVIAGFDERWAWSPEIPDWLRLVALGVATLGLVLGTWAMLENRFFSAVVRLQEERGHHVIDTGPYRLVRHPGYLGSLLGNPAIAVMLGSLWSLIPVVVAIGLFFARTVYEDQFLHEQLPGYADYAQKTRYKLIPGIW